MKGLTRFPLSKSIFIECSQPLWVYMFDADRNSLSLFDWPQKSLWIWVPFRWLRSSCIHKHVFWIMINIPINDFLSDDRAPYELMCFELIHGTRREYLWLSWGSPMPRRRVSEAHEGMNEIPTVQHVMMIELPINSYLFSAYTIKGESNYDSPEVAECLPIELVTRMKGLTRSPLSQSLNSH